MDTTDNHMDPMDPTGHPPGPPAEAGHGLLEAPKPWDLGRPGRPLARIGPVARPWGGRGPFRAGVSRPRGPLSNRARFSQIKAIG
jgi:hypothetical protein